jgi:hypothetical protein
MSSLVPAARRSRFFPDRRRLALAAACGLVSALVLPRALCGHDADRYLADDAEAGDALARGVAAAVTGRKERLFYRTGQARFDGQSAIAVYQMAVMGLGQVVLAHPDKRDLYLPAMRRAADRLVEPETLAYATRAYGHHGLTHMGPGEGHAYLGYVNLALGMLRAVDPRTRHAALHDRLTDALAERLARAPTGLIETYPGETWPPDVAAVAGSIGLHARITGKDRRALLGEWASRFTRCAVDSSGYLVQRVRSGTCVPRDAPRGSGTAIAAYFIGFAQPELARRLCGGLASEGRQEVLGFGAIREYARGYSGRGDGNSGPMMFGASVGATGFGLGAARTCGDGELFRSLYRTTHLVGAPVDAGGTRRFATGGVLGNALLLAMLTARPQ